MRLARIHDEHVCLQAAQGGVRNRDWSNARNRVLDLDEVDPAEDGCKLVLDAAFKVETIGFKLVGTGSDLVGQHGLADVVVKRAIMTRPIFCSPQLIP